MLGLKRGDTAPGAGTAVTAGLAAAAATTGADGTVFPAAEDIRDIKPGCVFWDAALLGIVTPPSYGVLLLVSPPVERVPRGRVAGSFGRRLLSRRGAAIPTIVAPGSSIGTCCGSGIPYSSSGMSNRFGAAAPW